MKHNINHLKRLQSFRRELHRNPELAFHEYQTAQRVKQLITEANPTKIIDKIGGTGMAFFFESGKPGPVIAIRSELDALPIEEINDFDYISSVDNISHKCGHDGHMTMVSGLAEMLRENPPEKGTVILLFQPAEETGEGALQMINDEKMKDIKPDYMFGLHNLPGKPAGQILSREGIFASASIGIIIRLKGKTSHAAEPENGLSPAIAMAQNVEMLSNLVTEVKDELNDFSLITVIHARLGEQAFGTTPGYAEVMGTIRSYQNEDLETLKSKATGKAKKIAHNHGLNVEIDWTEEFSSTENHPDCYAVVKQAAQNNNFDFKEMDEPYRWSEDFGYFTQKYKGAMFALGSGVNTPDLHNPDYDFPEKLIPYGLNMFMEIITLTLENQR
ncbi:MAG: amidohydrolase [Bacteroidales bacterium]